MAGSVLQRLGAAYKPDIENGDVITVNDERATPPAYNYIPETLQEVDLPIAGGHRITGWVALDKKTHNDDYFGLNLYRKGQLIEAWNKDFFPVHLMSSRVIGEVHLDFADTNYFKRGFEKTTVEWKLAREAMREFLRPLVAASGQMARNKNDPMRVTRAIQGLQAAMGHTSSISKDVTGDSEVRPPGRASTPEIELAPDMLYLPEPVRLVYTVGELDSELTPWDYVYDQNARELQAVMNSASRVFKESKDPCFLASSRSRIASPAS